MIRVRKTCKECGRTYTYDSRASIADDDPGCPSCEPENHEGIEFDDESGT
jgi:hypothetical protein